MSWPTVLAQPTPEAYAWKVVKNRTIDLARRRNRRPVVVDVRRVLGPYEQEGSRDGHPTD